MMALTVAWSLALVYAVAVPMGRRSEAVAVWAVRTISPPGNEGDARRAGRVVMGGWYALLNADLWLLPLLGALILLFEWWWMAPLLVGGAFALRWVADRLLPYPEEVEWYLERFQKAAAKKSDGDPAAEVVATRLTALLQRYAGTGCPLPTLEESRSAPLGGTDWLLERRGLTGTDAAARGGDRGDAGATRREP